jgi:hypothetical protein
MHAQAAQQLRSGPRDRQARMADRHVRSRRDLLNPGLESDMRMAPPHAQASQRAARSWATGGVAGQSLDPSGRRLGKFGTGMPMQRGRAGDFDRYLILSPLAKHPFFSALRTRMAAFQFHTHGRDHNADSTVTKTPPFLRGMTDQLACFAPRPMAEALDLSRSGR